MNHATVDSHQFKPAYSKLNGWLLLSIALLAAASYPAFTHEYLFHDDWIHYSGKAASCMCSPMHNWFTIMGRPLGHVILCLQYKIIGDISGAYIARGVTFLALAGLLAATFAFLRREHLPDNISAFLALGITLLPGFTISVSWLGAGFIVFSLLFSAISALLCQQALMQRKIKRNFFGLMLMAVVIQIASALIYQTGAMFFLVLITIFYAVRLSEGRQSIVRHLFLLIGTFFAANLIYFIGFKASVAAELLKVNPERGVLFHDLIGNVYWFIQYPLPRAFHLWFFQPSTGWTALPIVTLLTYIASLGVFIFSISYRKTTRYISVPVLIYLPATSMFGVACFLPMLVSSFKLEVFRSLIPLSSFIFSVTVIQFWLSFSMKESQSKGVDYSIALAMFIFAFISQNTMFSKIVMPKYSEVQYIKNVMQSAKEAGYSNVPVHVIVPRFVESWKTDEIGSLSASFSQDIHPMISIIRNELMLPYVSISYTKVGEHFDPDRKIVIDLSIIPNSGISDALLKYFKFDIPQYVAISSSTDGGRHPSSRAFDGSLAPDDFWETTIKTPVELDVDYRAPTTLKSYEFSAGETAERMPVSWKLIASADKQNWVTLDRINDFKNWGANLSMSFKIMNSQPYRYYRFIFEKSIDTEILRIYEIKLVEQGEAN